MNSKEKRITKQALIVSFLMILVVVIAISLFQIFIAEQNTPTKETTLLAGNAFHKGQFDCIDTPNNKICLIYGGLPGANDFIVNIFTGDRRAIAILHFPMIEEEIVLYENINGYPQTPVLFEIHHIDDDMLTLVFVEYIDNITDYMGEKWEKKAPENPEDADKMFPPKEDWIFDERLPKGFNELAFPSTSSF